LSQLTDFAIAQKIKNSLYSIHSEYVFAGVAQLVERHLPKVNVVSSSLITRYNKTEYLAGVAQW
jgi:hypothetical protein